MPYIKPKYRPQYDKHVLALASRLRNQDESQVDGHVNYIITFLLMLIYNQAGRGYFDLNRAIGTLESCKLEFYRIAVAPHEDVKKAQNGSV